MSLTNTQIGQANPNILETIKLDKALRIAKKKFKEGDVEKAKSIYGDVLQKFPKNKQALQGLKLLAAGNLPQGTPEEQLEYIGNLFNQGQLQPALILATEMLERYPHSSTLYNIVGASNAGLMNYAAAVNSYKKALKIDPAYADVYNNLGISQAAQGDIEAAIDSYKRAIKIKQNFAEAYNNMGISLKHKGLLEAALESYQEALKIKPDFADAYRNMGNALVDKDESEAALDSYREALKIKPDFAQANFAIGIVLRAQGNIKVAIDNFKRAIAINPDYDEAYLNLGMTFEIKGDLEEAMSNYDQTIIINPSYAEAHYRKGNVLAQTGALDAAIEQYKMALKINPDYQIVRANKLYYQASICDWAAIEQDRGLIAYLGTSTEPVNPYAIMSFEDDMEAHRLRSEIFSKDLHKHITRLPSHVRPRQKPHCLRIGYFSSDFREHAVAYLIAKVIETHDRGHFEVYGYGLGSTKNSDMRKRLISAFDVFKDVSDMTEKDVALLAHQDKLDIAIDLNGYTEGMRSGIFAYRAAPIQINYLGYSGTMGTDCIDYIIADSMVIPSDYEHYYNERILRLPNTFMPTDNTRLMSTRPITRSEMGLPEVGFVFCCFNNNFKVSAHEFDIWMRVLLKTEGSVLWMRNSNSWSEGNLRMHAQNRGVDPSRLVFAGRVSMDEHLARHKLADLFLDTFTYNAHTTASEALWAGLPVITKAGIGFSARAAASLLRSIDLSELITESEEEYEALILHLTINPALLKQIRKTLTNNLLSKPLFDTELYTKHLEDGYKQAYSLYFEGKPPKSIDVAE